MFYKSALRVARLKTCVGDWHIVGNTQIARDWSRKRVSFTTRTHLTRGMERAERFGRLGWRGVPQFWEMLRELSINECPWVFVHTSCPLRAFWYLLHVWTNMWRFFSCCFNALQTATEIILIMKRKNQKQNNSLSFNQIYYISL